MTAPNIPIEAQIEAVRQSAQIVRAGLSDPPSAPLLARAEALEAGLRTLIWVRDNADALRQAANAAKPAGAPNERRAFSSLGFAQQAALRGSDPRFWRFLGPQMGGAIIADEDGAAQAVRKLCAVISRKDFDASPAAAARWQALDARFCAWLEAAAHGVEGGRMSGQTTIAPPSRPVVRWHGGKWRLAPWIISHFPAHRIYVEPFGGGGSVLLRKPRSYAEVYNDLDMRVVTLFRVLRERDKAAELIRRLELTPFSREDFESAYSGAHETDVEIAWSLLVKCLMGFGTNAHGRKSGFRANSNRSGTSPAHDWRNYPETLVSVVDRLRGVVIENRPALDVMAAQDGPETLHYVDPPYVAETRDKGKDYEFELDEAQHRDLLARLNGLAGAVVLSGYRCALYDDLLPGWHRVDCAAYADGARPRVESLWLNPRAQQLARAPDLLGAAE